MKKLFKGLITGLLLLCLIGVTGCYTDAEHEEAMEIAEQLAIDAKADAIAEKDLELQLLAEEMFTQEEVDIAVEAATVITESSDTVKLLTGWDEKYPLGVGISVSLDDQDINSLLDAEIDFNGDDYDVEERLRISSDVRVVGSDESTYKEFENTPCLVVETRGAIVYDYIFKDMIDYTEIDEDDSLQIDFLGLPLEIIFASASKIKIQLGEKNYLSIDETATIGEKVLTLVNVGSNGAAVVDVSGVRETIHIGNSETVNGIELSLVETFYSSEKTDRFAEIYAGENVVETINDGDDFELFGVNEDEWVWEIETDGDYLKRLSAVYNQKRDDLDDEFPPLKVGEYFTLPNDYLKFGIIDIKELDFVKLEIEDDNTFDYEVTLDREEGFICNDEEFTKVYVNFGTGFFDKDENPISCSVLEIEDTDFSLNKKLKLKQGSSIYLDLVNLPSHYGSRDELVMDNYGLQYSFFEDWVDDEEELTIEIPEEEFEVNVGVF